MLGAYSLRIWNRQISSSELIILVINSKHLWYISIRRHVETAFATPSRDQQSIHLYSFKCPFYTCQRRCRYLTFKRRLTCKAHCYFKLFIGFCAHLILFWDKSGSIVFVISFFILDLHHHTIFVRTLIQIWIQGFICWKTFLIQTFGIKEKLPT